VQPHPLASQQLGVDRLGQQRMPEQVAVAAGVGQQQLLVDRLPQAFQQLLVVHAGDRGQQRLGGPRAGRGRHPQQLLGAVAQPDHPGEQHLPQAWRQRARVGALAGQQQLLGKERVAARARMDAVDQPGGWVGAQQAGQQLGQFGAGEPRQLQPLHAAVAGQLAQQPAQRVPAVQLVAAEGPHHQHPPRPQRGGEEGEQVAGGAVGPVQILYDPQQRRGGGQPLDHPQQQRKQPPLAGLASARGTGVGGRLATPGQVGQQPSQLLAGGAGDRRQLGRVQVADEAVQRLDDRRERQPLLAQRHTTATQHPHPLLGGGGGQLLDQPGLADPGLPAEHRQQRLAVGGAGQQLAQPRQLLGAAHKPPGRNLVGHVGPSMPRRYCAGSDADLKIPERGSEDPG
jgi:hypothetical protein